MEDHTTQQPQRTKKRALISDAELENEEKLNNHVRRQQVLDAATRIGIFFLYLAAIAVVLFIIALTYNFIVNDEWVKIEEYTRMTILALVSFIFGVISDQVIKKNRR